MYGVFRKSEQVKMELFGVSGGKEVLKKKEKWSEKASAINCSYVIILSPSSIWVTDQ
jgi:hypothetical protein